MSDYEIVHNALAYWVPETKEGEEFDALLRMEEEIQLLIKQDLALQETGQ